MYDIFIVGGGAFRFHKYRSFSYQSIMNRGRIRPLLGAGIVTIRDSQHFAKTSFAKGVFPLHSWATSTGIRLWPKNGFPSLPFRGLLPGGSQAWGIPFPLPTTSRPRWPLLLASTCHDCSWRSCSFHRTSDRTRHNREAAGVGMARR